MTTDDEAQHSGHPADRATPAQSLLRGLERRWSKVHDYPEVIRTEHRAEERRLPEFRQPVSVRTIRPWRPVRMGRGSSRSRRADRGGCQADRPVPLAGCDWRYLSRTALDDAFGLAAGQQEPFVAQHFGGLEAAVGTKRFCESGRLIAPGMAGHGNHAGVTCLEALGGAGIHDLAMAVLQGGHESWKRC